MKPDSSEEFTSWLVASGAQIWPNWCPAGFGMQTGVTWFPQGSVIASVSSEGCHSPAAPTIPSTITERLRFMGMQEQSTSRLFNMGDLWLLTIVEAPPGVGCTLNLKTMRPTKNSRLQCELPFSLKQALVNAIVPLTLSMAKVKQFNENNQDLSTRKHVSGAK
jgi:hypothetical protein